MNIFITSTSLLSICLFSSCSTINGYRQPTDTWGKKQKEEKKEQTTEVTKKVELPQQRVVSRNSPIQGIPTSSGNDVKKVIKKKATKGQTGRIVPGFIEPNVTNLPDNKDLQEANNVAPAPSPLAPKYEAPVAPLLPTAPALPSLPDPSESLPPIE